MLAQEEAYTLPDATSIDTDALLLGLLAEAEGVAAKALEAVGVTYVAAKEAAGATATTQRDKPLPFSKETRRALDLALRKAIELNNNYIGTEHLLLALMDPANPATPAQALVAKVVGAGEEGVGEMVRSEVIKMLAGYAANKETQTTSSTVPPASLTPMERLAAAAETIATQFIRYNDAVDREEIDD